MIDLSAYHLHSSDRIVVEKLLAKVGTELSLEQLWQLMDEAWDSSGCDNQKPDPLTLACFYSNPVWLLNGMFIEQHELSMHHRESIAAVVASLKPQRVLDFGGGFGTLARLLANALPHTEVHICEPYPPLHAIQACMAFNNIKYVTELIPRSVDVLLCTDVLEHVPDPLAVLVPMVSTICLGGHLIVANCFYPVIKCHLPCTFHFRYSFDDFCLALGLESFGPCDGTHSTIYRRTKEVEPDWERLRAMERRSQQFFPWRQWHSQNIGPWSHRAKRAITEPFYYSRKLIKLLRPKY
jgi:2-polyprenyl-3-methyl-5-hydroxy-6-metoxy-1,4-benzoquinol methylase